MGTGPGADHVNGGLARDPVKGVAQCLAIQGDDLSGRQIPGGLNPADKAVLEFQRVQASQDPGKGVMGRNAIMEEFDSCAERNGLIWPARGSQREE
jgi:hypothetical protein